MGGEQHPKGIVSKRFWGAIGFNHVSIDLNGLDGALSYDLREDINIKYNYKEQFDIIYDGGTIEHVSNQYWAFKNTHNLTKRGGTMIHVLPKVGFWEGHCSYFYTMDSFSKLAELCSYEIKELKEIDAILYYDSYKKSLTKEKKIELENRASEIRTIIINIQ